MASPYADALPDLAGPGRGPLHLVSGIHSRHRFPERGHNKSVQVTRGTRFGTENDVFGRRFMPKPGRRLLVIAHFHRKLVPARLRRLLVIGVFRAWLIAHTHREMRVFAEISSQP